VIENCEPNFRIGSNYALRTIERPLPLLIVRKLPFRSREEFRMPIGVRKSPKNEPAGRIRGYGDLKISPVMAPPFSVARGRTA
jgi:hypothetical protein